MANSQSAQHPFESSTTNINFVRSHGGNQANPLGNSARTPGPTHEGSGLYFMSNGSLIPVQTQPQPYAGPVPHPLLLQQTGMGAGLQQPMYLLNPYASSVLSTASQASASPRKEEGKKPQMGTQTSTAQAPKKPSASKAVQSDNQVPQKGKRLAKSIETQTSQVIRTPPRDNDRIRMTQVSQSTQFYGDDFSIRPSEVKAKVDFGKQPVQQSNSREDNQQ